MVYWKRAQSPFPTPSIIPSVLYGCVTMPSCDSGLGFPHPVEHTGTLTPPAHHHFWQRQELPRGRIGRGPPPPRATPHSLINKGYALSQQSTDESHLSFPDALMARHNAGGGAGRRSGAVPASVSSGRRSRSKGPSARLLTPTAYHTRRHAVSGLSL